jgi:hypothetical protein
VTVVDGGVLVCEALRFPDLDHLIQVDVNPLEIKPGPVYLELAIDRCVRLGRPSACTPGSGTRP